MVYTTQLILHTSDVRHQCPGCRPGGLDLSPAVFNSFVDPDVGLIYGSWHFVDNAAVANAGTPRPLSTTSWSIEPSILATQSTSAQTTQSVSSSVATTPETSVTVGLPLRTRLPRPVNRLTSPNEPPSLNAHGHDAVHFAHGHQRGVKVSRAHLSSSNITRGFSGN